jgi:hypothetical protein
MSKLPTLPRVSIVTANRLLEGDVVYRTAVGRWSPRLADAAFTAEENVANSWLEAAQGDVVQRLIAPPYLAEMGLDAVGGLIALDAKERIRAAGPTVRLDLGKQAAA